MSLLRSRNEQGHELERKIYAEVSPEVILRIDLILSEVSRMLLLLLIIALIIASCLLIILLFGLVRAGRRADEGEEKILEIILPRPTIDNAENASQDKTKQESPPTPREQHDE